jgi:hypothetical protein
MAGEKPPETGQSHGYDRFAGFAISFPFSFAAIFGKMIGL